MERLKQLRISRGLSMRECSRLLNLPYTTYVNYEKGFREPNSEILILLANFFGVTIDYLIGRSDNPTTPAMENIIPMPKMKTVPLLGAIACGEPILAAENVEGDVDLPDHVHADFALRCRGDSMINARIYDGDVVYIRQQDTVQDGEIAAVLIGDEATLKRVRLFTDHVVLEPENPQYRPTSFWGEEAAGIRILGKAVAFTSAVR